MTDQQLVEYAHFWGSDKDNYVLLSIDPTGADLRRCMIVNRQYKGVELIENHELALEVLQRMFDAGVEIVRELPVE